MSAKHTRQPPRFQLCLPQAMAAALRKQADAEGIGYNVLIRRILREYMLDNNANGVGSSSHGQEGKAENRRVGC